MAFKDILTNAKYGDDIVLSLPDGTTATLGEMRSLEANERKNLITRQQALEAAEQGIMTRVNTLKTAGLLDDNLNPVTSRQTQRQIEQQVSNMTGLTEDDPLFGPVVKEFKSELAAVKDAAQKEIDAIKGQFGQLAGATKQAVTGYLNDYYGATFATSAAALPEPVRKDLKLEAVIDFATKRKLLDEVGRLDISAAVDRMTWDARKEFDRGEIAKDAGRVKQDRETLAQMQRPGASHRNPLKPQEGQFNPVDDKGKTKSLDDAIAAAGQDDELWNSALRSAGTAIQ